MKRLIMLVAMASAVVVFMSGCAGVTPFPGGTGGAYGLVYTQTGNAYAVGTADGSDKVGTATSTAIVCFATGDSSIKAACDSAGITKIHHVDSKVMSVLGVYAKYTTIVYGQ